MHFQLQSSLCSLPLELREEIYRYLDLEDVHIFLKDGSIAVSPCFEPSPSNELDDLERRPEASGSVSAAESEAQYGRRLESTWGPHWRCEEAALGEENDGGKSSSSVLRLHETCVFLREDVTNFLRNVHITDIETLGMLLNVESYSSQSGRTTPMIIPSSLNVRSLSVTLRLPHLFFLELQTDPLDEFMFRRLRHRDRILAWRDIWSNVSQLKGLRRLRLWLDHTETYTWTDTNERRALAHILPLASTPSLDLTINLPHLHPQWAYPHWHFLPEDTSSPFNIIRRVHQCYFYRPNEHGSLQVKKYEPESGIVTEVFVNIEQVPRRRSRPTTVQRKNIFIHPMRWLRSTLGFRGQER